MSFKPYPCTRTIKASEPQQENETIEYREYCRTRVVETDYVGLALSNEFDTHIKKQRQIWIFI